MYAVVGKFLSEKERGVGLRIGVVRDETFGSLQFLLKSANVAEGLSDLDVQD